MFSWIESRNAILQQKEGGNFTESTTRDRILVDLDGVVPSMPPISELNLVDDMVTAFLAFLYVSGRLLIFALQYPWARTMATGVLTESQVHELEEEEHEILPEDAEGESTCCCAICLDEFEHKEKLRVLPCRHKFHEMCLVPWLTEWHSSCPLCKYDVFEHILS
jgi:hypothetical protein